MANSQNKIQNAATAAVDVFTNLNRAIKSLQSFAYYFNNNKIGNINNADVLWNVDTNGNVSGTNITPAEFKKAMLFGQALVALLDGTPIANGTTQTGTANVFRDDLEAISKP